MPHLKDTKTSSKTARTPMSTRKPEGLKSVADLPESQQEAITNFIETGKTDTAPKPMTEPEIKFGLAMKKSLHTKVKLLGVKKDISMNEIICTAIAEYVKGREEG
jgi:predicted HicB family RNase H-like nuclease